ncbi:MAG: NAD-dependent DNA ligase LigA [Candidatus Pacebacteria bacterium]|nr:NAD-dependent DNA ligase LigA [Candidatus Paceibacterota bacterium]
MDPADAQAEMCRLIEELNRHNYLYYVLAAPEISDREYDRLYQRLTALESDFPDLVSVDSPTQRVGGQPLDKFTTVRHALPMISLDNTYNPDELRAFHRRVCERLGVSTIRYIVEPKIDGVSLSVRYEGGLLTRAVTRGNGREGDDITANVRTIRSIPLRLRTLTPPPVWEARGEVFMADRDFANLNDHRAANGDPPFANARNATAGSLKLLDPQVVAQRPLDALFYAHGESVGISPDSQKELLGTLQALGFKTPEFIQESSGVDDVLEAIAELDRRRALFPYQIDGAVIKVDDIKVREILGATAKAPRWAIAYKYEAEKATTRLKAVTIQVGRLGTLTPVADLEPVVLAGSTISRATLHNFRELERKDIRIGDRVEIEKAGEVIPAVVRALKGQRTGGEQVLERPTHCPVCHEPVHESEAEVALRCVNPTCPAQVRERLRHFASRGAMDIESLGDALVQLLVDSDIVHNPADLYELDVTAREQLCSFPGLGSKSVANLMAAIEQSKKQSPWRLLFGLGIRHVGARAAQTLTRHFSGIDRLMSCTVEELQDVSEVGPVMAESIVAFFSNAANRELLDRLREAGLRFVEESLDEGPKPPSFFAGKTCVLTGSLQSLSREQVREKLEAMGARVTGSVTSKTDFLIVGADPGAKLGKARNLGVAILDEEALLAHLDSSPKTIIDESEADAGEKGIPVQQTFGF